MVRYYGWYNNKSRGIRRKATQEEVEAPRVLLPDPSASQYRRHWAQLI
ncbi:MAG: hypothetical protein HYS70_02065 [Nitrospinae bacterium]|nr:hypothetical protein [Nitrospinota bacterium]